MHDLRALVVDDSKVGRLTMLKKLEAIGVKVDLTESGQQALDYLAQNQPDLIFMDHMMPDMDGFEVTRRIKAAPATRNIPVFIVSGSDDEAFVQQARAIGATNAIAKPPAAGVLETILGSLPKPGAGPAAGAVAEAAPQPAAVEPAPVPSMDRAEVHALVERLLGGAMDHLHEGLLADIGKRVEAKIETQRQTLQEWRVQLDQAAAGIAELTSKAAETETLGKQLNAIEQRLLPLESAAARPVPDIDVLRQDVEKRIASGLAEFQAKTEHEAPQSEDLRRELLSRMDDHGAAVEQRVGGLDGRLDGLSADVSRVSDDVQSALAELQQHIEALEKRLEAAEATEATPGLDAETLLAATDERISPRLEDLRQELLAGVEGRGAQAEQRVGELGGRLDSLAKDVGQLVEDAQSGQTALQQRIEALENRLEAAEATGAAPGLDAETVLAAMDERISPRLEEMRNAFGARLEERMSMPLEDAVRERLLTPLREQLEALRAELEGQRAQVGTVQNTQNALRDELAAQGEALRAQMEEAREGLLAQYEQAQAQWSAGLEAQQSQQAYRDENLGRLQALEQRLDAIPEPDVDAAAQRVLEQRIAQMREVIGAALQPAYPDTVGGMQPRAEVGHEIGERAAQPPAEGWNDGLKAELDQLKGKVKTLSIALIIGGVVLLAAVGMLFLKG
jgi:CheY-like chemotaxis protein